MRRHAIALQPAPKPLRGGHGEESVARTRVSPSQVEGNTSVFFVLSTATMVLYLIGLGLADEQDITLKGLRAIQSCSKVYLESYTSILLVDDFQKRMVCTG